MKPFGIQLKKRERVLLGAGGALATLVLLVRFVYLPLISQIGEQRAELNGLRVKIADAHMVAGRLESEEGAIREARARYLVLERRIGEGQSLARILESLRQLAEELRLELVMVQPRTVKSGQPVVTLGPGTTFKGVPLSLRLGGRYRQLVEFFDRLVHAPFIASIQKLQVTKPEARSAQLRAELALALYLPEQGALP